MAPAVLLTAVLLAACASAPPRETLHDRQARTLSSLGFQQSDGDWLLSLPERISFEFDQDDLNETSRYRIADMARQLLAVEIRKVRIEGHTDNLGASSYNQALSLRRAKGVAAVLLANGFAETDVTAAGMGSAYPAAGNDSADGRAQNRRVEVIVSTQSLATP